ncbi:hamartin isoform X4 [Diabrotica virgifera virgifera]|uniref:Hamartin n=1 Tax=Diabrotica virgifera virgifera TaxID=50390 RepID=A0ABM5JNQ4_DIAVI|nr:hamartin isoform X4 [Diabrotica virgifera virgifera]
MTELFENLESNNRTAVEDAKEKLRELFLKVNEPWLLNGLYEYYLSTSSPRAMEILVNIKEPHHIYLFDRISDSIKGPKVEIKVQALTLFGYVARRQPTWLYKLQEHILLRDILKLLRNEVELLPLISALLVLIVLLPMIPSSMGNCLRDIFDIFSRLASWNCNPGKIVEDQLIHMQVALYALFLRLYGMYPCNFLGYLKVQYKDKNTPVFVHTIKPMLDTVKMHPSLVTATEETEVTTERWRSMGVHDVIVECERFSLDLTDRCPHDSCQIASGFRSRSGTSNSTIESSYHLQNLKSLATLQMPAVESPSFFSPSVMFKENSSHFSSLQSSSPPEAAMEATPETTPVRITETSVSVTTDLTRSKPNPSSPLRITNAELSSRHFNISQRCESPRSLEDEVLSVVSKIDDPKNRGNQFSIQDLDEVLDVTLGEEPEHGSPCTEGGLHMPNSKSMNNFAKRVQRLRHHSTCNPEPEKLETSTGSSPGNGIPFSPSTTVRRAISCPEMKKSPTNPSKDNMDRPLKETDEDAQEKIGNFAPQKSKSATNNSTLAKSENKFIKTYSCTMTQTETFWPYEHLFLGVFPSLDNSEMKPSPDASPAPFHISQEKTLPSSIYDTLDHYIAVAVRSSDKHSKEHMKEQLELVHQQLLFERHRRETHAYRNRRLLSDAKSTRSLEEYNSALRDTVQLQQKDLDDLRAQLDSYKKERSNEDKKLNKTINYWEKQCKSLQEEVKTLEENNDRLTKDLTDFKSKCSISDTKLLELQEQLQETLADANTAKQEALQGVKVTKELQQVNKDMVMIGELHAKYQERLDSLDVGKVYQCELDEVRKACHDDVKVLNQQLDNKMASLEAYRTRVLELEHVIVSKDDLILSQKQMLAAINEEKFEKLEAVESKYQTQLTINRSLEEKILDLWQRLELGKTSVHSPDTSSCHEVNVTTTAGFSPHSSPLSASLASSEGSTAFHEREVKNLQAIVDQRETPSGSKSKFDESGDSLPEHEG